MGHLAEQPAGQTLRVFQPNATIADPTVRVVEEIAVGGIVQVNAEIVRHHELDVPHRIAPARQLANPDLQIPAGDRLPIDRGGIDRNRGIAPVGHDLVTLGIEISQAVGEHPGRDQGLREIGWNVPVGVDACMPDHGGHHWSRARLLADDHLHIV